MGNTLYAVRQQCHLATTEMMGHGGWEKVDCDAFVDGESGKIVPLICALKESQIYEASGDELQKVLDEYFPVKKEGTIEAFRVSWEEHRRAESEYKSTWGDQGQKF